MNRYFKSFAVLLLIVIFLGTSAAQTGGHMLYGDFKVDSSKVNGTLPLTFDLILYFAGRTVSRQTVVNNSRYRFMDLNNGDYDLVVEVENNEVARLRINLNGAYKTDIRQDVELEWKETPGKNTSKISAIADFYERNGKNRKRFEKAQRALDEKNYEEAIVGLRQILSEDEKDYQSWSELGTAYLMQRKFEEAESAYVRATAANSTYFLSFFNLGRVRIMQKKFEAAVEPLSEAVKIRPESPDANFYLGEAYLQIKKGSKAVGYLNEAIRLDPVRMAEAHLRLATLYDRAGGKDRAAAEYEMFLAKTPAYRDRQKLQQYIEQNKKP